MASDPDAFNTEVHPTVTTFRPQIRRKISLRRRRLPTVRLGGKKPRKGFFLVRLFRRAKLKSLKLKYSTLLKKLRDSYRSLVNDIIEGAGTIEAFQQRLLLETSFAVPVMGFSLNSLPSNYGLDRP